MFEIREPLIPTRAEPSEGVNGIQRGVEEMEIPNGQPQRKKKVQRVLNVYFTPPTV